MRFWENCCRSLFCLWLRTPCVCSWKGVDWRRRYPTLDKKAWCLSSTLSPTHLAFLLNNYSMNGSHPADRAPCAAERWGAMVEEKANKRTGTGEKPLQIINSSQYYFKTKWTREGTCPWERASCSQWHGVPGQPLVHARALTSRTWSVHLASVTPASA